MDGGDAGAHGSRQMTRRSGLRRIKEGERDVITDREEDFLASLTLCRKNKGQLARRMQGKKRADTQFV